MNPPPKSAPNPGHGMQLPAGHRVEQFEIVKMLGKGGFGITYLAKNTATGQPVALKELLPDGIAMRDATGAVSAMTEDDEETLQWAKNSFLRETMLLAKFDHPNIVKVIDVFEARGSAYCVMELIDGESLGQLVSREKKLPVARVKEIALAVVAGLEEVHGKDVLHRDIKPGNIMLTSGGTPVLIDFGAARQKLEGRSQSMTNILTPGFAPLEQYSTDAAFQGPWTDFYALSAVCYRCLTGERPTDAAFRFSKQKAGEPDPIGSLSKQFSHDREHQPFLRALDRGLLLEERNRPQTAAEFRRFMEGTANESVIGGDAVSLELLAAKEKLRQSAAAGKRAMRQVSQKGVEAGSKVLAGVIRWLRIGFGGVGKAATAIGRQLPGWERIRRVFGIWGGRIANRFRGAGSRLAERAARTDAFPLTTLFLLFRLDFVRHAKNPSATIRAILSRAAMTRVLSQPFKRWGQRRRFRS